MNALSEKGVDLYDADDGIYHVSGPRTGLDIQERCTSC